MSNEIKPRIDGHGVGWCLGDCLQWDYIVRRCRLLGKEDGLYVCPGYPCIPRAREAATDHAAMEAVRADEDAGKNSYTLRRCREAWHAIVGGSYANDPSPTQAILKAAEAAEKEAVE